MSDDRPRDVLSSLPRRRPHRRSDKRGPRPLTSSAPPAGKPAPAPAPTGTDILQTAVRVATELAEIGITVSARALRNTLWRLPRP